MHNVMRAERNVYSEKAPLPAGNRQTGVVERSAQESPCSSLHGEVVKHLVSTAAKRMKYGESRR